MRGGWCQRAHKFRQGQGAVLNTDGAPEEKVHHVVRFTVHQVVLTQLRQEAAQAGSRSVSTFPEAMRLRAAA